jgi:hypothetical protein
MIHDRGTWYLFYEVCNVKTKRGEIGFSTSKDLLKWNYGGIVLQERFHLSYPYVFRSHRKRQAAYRQTWRQSHSLWKPSYPIRAG